MRDACAVVLAGGLSTRMGFDKATLPIDGVPLLTRVLMALRREYDEVAVVAKDPARYSALLPDRHIALVMDETPLQNPLAGLVAGLAWAPHERVFVCAVDMPFAATAALLDRLESVLSADVDAAAFVRDERLEPLHAFYRRSACLPVARRLLAEGRGPRHVLETVRTVAVPVECATERAALFDIDTPTDAAQLLLTR